MPANGRRDLIRRLKNNYDCPILVCFISVWSHNNSALFEIMSHDSALGLAYFQVSTHSPCFRYGNKGWFTKGLIALVILPHHQFEPE